MHTDSSFTFVLFGGTGDLSMRKILPALFEAHRANMLAESGRIVAVARHESDRASYLEWVDTHVKPHAAKAAGKAFDEAAWKSFLDRIEYVHLDLGRAEDYVAARRGGIAARHPRVLSRDGRRCSCRSARRSHRSA